MNGQQHGQNPELQRLFDKLGEVGLRGLEQDERKLVDAMLREISRDIMEGREPGRESRPLLQMIETQTVRKLTEGKELNAVEQRVLELMRARTEAKLATGKKFTETEATLLTEDFIARSVREAEALKDRGEIDEATSILNRRALKVWNDRLDTKDPTNIGHVKIDGAIELLEKGLAIVGESWVLLGVLSYMCAEKAIKTSKEEERNKALEYCQRALNANPPEESVKEVRATQKKLTKQPKT